MATEGVTATADQFMSALDEASEECLCWPADGMSPCDAIYGGLWTVDLDGSDCEGPEPEPSGASYVASAALALAAAVSLLF